MRHRPRSVWFALGTGVVLTIIVAGAVLTPVTGLVGAAIAATPVIPFPVAGMVVTVIAGYALSAGFLALILRLRNGALAWISAVAAVIAALVVSVYPLGATAIAAARGAGDAVPTVLEWIEKIQQLLP